jgi:hypothetical protein
MKKRKCANSNCDEYFEIKNAIKRFCCLSCKNNAAYEYEKKIYSWEIKQFKGRRKNIKILEYVMLSGRTIISLRQLKILGFDFDAAYISLIDEDKNQIFRYGNIGVKSISKKLFKLSHIKN